MILESFITGVKNLFANKLRSALSMLGIIFGVGTLVATMSIGEGTKQQILETVEALGSNLITVDRDYTRIRVTAQSAGPTFRDVELLEEHCPLIERIAPLKTEFLNVSSGGKSFLTTAHGTDPDFEEIYDFHVESGRFITSKDVQERSKVCVVGADVADKLEMTDIVGKTIDIGTDSFLVVGVMERLGRSKLRKLGPDTAIILPVSVLSELSSRPDSLNMIIIKAVSSDLAEQARDEIEALLLHFHQQSSPDFAIWTQEELLQKKKEYAQVFQIALGSIAIVSLIIGGIGIMNILLASVNERIKEVGIRKALGANPLDIMLQFLSESFILTIVGGLIGVFVGRFMGNRIAPILTERLPQREFVWKSVTSPEIIIIAFAFALVTGFVFGLYPAVKASRLDPSEALTYE